LIGASKGIERTFWRLPTRSIRAQPSLSRPIVLDLEVAELGPAQAKETSSSCSVAVSWEDIVTVVCQRHYLLGARKILGNLSALPITIMPVDSNGADFSELFKYQFKIPCADVFIGSLTLGLFVGPPQDQATLVTAGFDFKDTAKKRAFRKTTYRIVVLF
jgi:hypothetical protein